MVLRGTPPQDHFIFSWLISFAYLRAMTIVRYLPSLDTPRLTLREMQPGDAPNLAAYLIQPKYQKYVAHRLKDDHEVVAFVRRTIGSQGDFRRRIFHIVAEQRSSSEVTGDAFVIIHQDTTLEIGWGVDPDFWRQGFGTEIGRAVLALCFEHFRAEQVWCKVMAENAPSLKLARRIGMQLDRTMPGFVVGGGRTETVQIFRMPAEGYFDQPY
jgi:ribosomal-protein-alanine N-acetyltransferase